MCVCVCVCVCVFVCVCVCVCVCVGFRSIAEASLHNVVDGGSLELLPAEAAPDHTPYLILSPSYLVVTPGDAATLIAP